MSDLKIHEASLANGIDSVMAGFHNDPAWPYPERVDGYALPLVGLGIEFDEQSAASRPSSSRRATSRSCR